MSHMDAEAMALQGVRAAASLQGPGLSKEGPAGDAMHDPVVVNFIEYYYKGELFAGRGASHRTGGRVSLRGEGAFPMAANTAPQPAPAPARPSERLRVPRRSRSAGR